jgi:hypothetical protein
VWLRTANGRILVRNQRFLKPLATRSAAHKDNEVVGQEDGDEVDGQEDGIDKKLKRPLRQCVLYDVKLVGAVTLMW